MSSFLLDEESQRKISDELPDTDSVQKKILSFDPTMLSTNFQHDSMIPIASVCLKDAVHTLQESRYGLREALAHKILHEEKQNPPNKEDSIFFQRYYCDDVAFRLYSAGEDLANAIIFMLDIDKNKVIEYRGKHCSQQSAVGNFLKKEKFDNLITKQILRLACSIPGTQYLIIQ